jgi:hypothetical protein
MFESLSTTALLTLYRVASKIPSPPPQDDEPLEGGDFPYTKQACQLLDPDMRR